MGILSRDLYKSLFLVRKAEDLIIEYYSRDEMKTPMHMSMGQEAIAVGVCHAIDPLDPIFASYRSHAAFLAKTGDTRGFFAELHGKSTGSARGKAGSMHLASPEKAHLCSSAIVASCIPVALGSAFASRSQKTGRIPVVFFGEGAADEGVFWESLNVACAMGLGVLFVCEDNGLAVHTSKSVRQGYPDLREVVRQFRCRVFTDASNDVERIVDLTSSALDYIRSTQAPAFLHLECYRYLEHVGIAEDFAAGYRFHKDFEKWKTKDCLLLQRERLLHQGVPEASIAKDEAEITKRLCEHLEAARRDPFPDDAELWRGVFHEKT